MKYVLWQGLLPYLGYLASLGVNGCLCRTLCCIWEKHLLPCSFAIPLLAAGLILQWLCSFCERYSDVLVRSPLWKLFVRGALEIPRLHVTGLVCPKSLVFCSCFSWSEGCDTANQDVPTLLLVFIVSSFIMIVPVNFLGKRCRPPVLFLIWVLVRVIYALT